jgi:hypothetical protein
MRCVSLIVVLAAAWLGGSVTTLQAQCWSGCRHCCPGYYGGYGGGGVVLLYDLGGYAARRYVGQSQQHLLGQQIAAAQAAALQSDIRNAMAVEAQRRSEQIFSQQQTDRDWWLQVQQQQVAQRQQAAQWAVMTAGFKPARPRAPTDLIKWPLLLQAPPFAEQRAQIEAPYRGSSKGSRTPTAADYKSMIQAAEQMRSILKEMTATLTAHEYLDSQAFLDRLAGEARGRLEKATPKK